jgi:hypothetical protein
MLVMAVVGAPKMVMMVVVKVTPMMIVRRFGRHRCDGSDRQRRQTDDQCCDSK